jgi:DUF4097 and DUF4098 domain-containing protein YvlB
MEKRWIIPVILVALLVVCAGMVAVAFFAANLYLRPVTSRIIGQGANISAKATEQLTFDVTGPATLDVDSPFGDITITAGDSDSIEVTAEKTAWGMTQEQAEERLNDLTIQSEHEGNRVRLEVKYPSRPTEMNVAGSVDFTIQVPVETTLIIHTSSGNIAVSGTQGKADLDTSFGNVEVNHLRGGLAVRSSSGELTVRDVQPLESGDGDITLRSQFGNITLEDVRTQKVDVNTNSGTLTLSDIESGGPITLESGFGNIRFTRGQGSESTIQGNNGSIRLADLELSGALTVDTDFGEVELKNVTATAYDLHSGSGSITVDGAQAGLKAHTDFGDIRITGGNQATLDLESQSGGITYQGSLGDGPHRLTTKFGRVELSLPEDSAFNFDLKSNFGEIRSDFPVAIQGEPDEKHWQGTVNDGGPLLTISTENGPITLKRYRGQEP